MEDKKLCAAIARAERAEEALRDLRGWTGMLAAQAKNIPLDIMEQVVSVCKKADFVLSSPPADASAMGGDHIGDATEMVGEREQRLADSLYEIINYSGGADNALEDEYVMDRARAVLAEMEQKS